jgi:hypothetical protein
MTSQTEMWSWLSPVNGPRAVCLIKDLGVAER